jgi:hypothetical protein
MHPFVDHTGRRYGRLLVISRIVPHGKYIKYNCLCDCGKEVVVLGQSLTNGDKQSCGCLRQELYEAGCGNLTHGEARTGRITPEYRAWRNMLTRCTLPPDDRAYKYYVGRGIRVCERWRISFVNFLNDVGRRPSPQHSIDRIDVNGNYEPGNVRWATRMQQAWNKQSNFLYTLDDEPISMREMARYLAIPHSTLQAKLEKAK